ncbi:AMP-binding protein, partial [Campylobacter novaezeelandiae]
MVRSIYDFLEKSVLKFPEKLAFVDIFGSNFKSISYKEFDILSKKLASKIAKDLQYSYTQNSILILLPKSIDCLISFFGVSLSGNFYTLLDEKTPKERIEKVINILKP